MERERRMEAAFEAACHEVLEEMGEHGLDRVEVTREGRVVAVVTAAPEAGRERALHGFMRGSVKLPPGFDLTAPILDEPFDVESGRLQG